MRYIWLFVFVVCGAFSCADKVDNDQESQTEQMKEHEEDVSNDLSLHKHGIPVSFPLSSSIKNEKAENLIQWKIYVNADLPILISMWDSESNSALGDLVDEEKYILSSYGGFKILKDEPTGFIYQVSYDGEVHYGFYHCLIKEGKAIQFSQSEDEGIFYSLNEIENMFAVSKSSY